jgi:hypothetical protein
MLGSIFHHSHFIASEGNFGVYTTVADNEVITFPKQLSTLEIYAPDSMLEIRFNNDPYSMYIDKWETDGIMNMPIKRITVLGAAGQKIRWKGLVSADNV